MCRLPTTHENRMANSLLLACLCRGQTKRSHPDLIDKVRGTTSGSCPCFFRVLACMRQRAATIIYLTGFAAGMCGHADHPPRILIGLRPFSALNHPA